TGVHEVTAFAKGGVDESLEELEDTAQDLEGMTFEDLASFDEKCRELDGTKDLSKIGGNTIVALSMAMAKAMASTSGEPLYKYLLIGKSPRIPYPLGNVLGGGEHAGPTAPDIQEFLALPLGAESFHQAAFGNAKVHKKVKELILKKDKTFTGGKGDEGAWAPNLENQEALEILAKACEEISGELGFEIKPGLDVAASSLYDEESEKYEYSREGESRDTGEQIDFILELINTYNLTYVEDPIWEEDFKSFAEITKKVGQECLICGDDLFVTNVERIQKGIENNSANAVLIKPNQIGTLTDTRKAVELTKKNVGIPVMSHRSGETPDTTIAHLAVGYGCPIIKTGVVGGERIAKLNELIRVEDELGEEAQMGEI
ncbi:enolase, partial [candidate division MSBL1 archaeon SCGC-AAA261O19]